MRRLLTIGHSYVVAQNRRLAHEMAVAGAGEWQVAAAAPARFRGDLRRIELEAMRGEACELVPLDIRLASSPHLFVYRGLRAVMTRGWDVVHCWEEPYIAAGAQVARLTPPAARFVPATFQNIRKRYPLPFRWFERHTMSRADGWIAFGESVHATHRDRRRYTSRPARVIPPGVDVGSFRPDPVSRRAVRARLGWPDAALVVGFAGRFVPEKGADLLMRVLGGVGSAWHALFVGGGPLQPDLERFAAARPGHVRVVTGVDHDSVPAHLNAMDVLCAPSRTTSRWREQFGRMLIEAMACGVPIVASRSGEIPHVVGDAGVLLEEGDEAAWPLALGALLSDPDRRAEMSRRGLARVHERYAWPVVARAHLTFFEALLSR